MRLARLLPALLLAAGVALLAGCAGDGEVKDGAPSGRVDASDIADAKPRPEPRARYGNHSPYEVFGRTYHVMASAQGYDEVGTASWYGTKFHGRRTSSGEPYDMYKATAAHKYLPLPTYAEVTNLDNGKRVIVKINDRGPFKDDRIIDMSYGAALRLGMTDTGTARVRVRAIDTGGEARPQRVSARSDSGTFLQVGAFGSKEAAERLAGRMTAERLNPVSIEKGNGLYRVWIGPYRSEREVDATVARVVELGYERPHRVWR